MAVISITPANVLPGAAASNQSYRAGAAITAGQVCYIDPADSNRAKLASATGTGIVAVVAGIALNNAATGQPVILGVVDPDLTIGAGVTAGAVVILGATAGSIHPSADAAATWKVTVLGVGTGSSKMAFAPIAGGTIPE